jgi:hypothetical protein
LNIALDHVYEAIPILLHEGGDIQSGQRLLTSIHGRNVRVTNNGLIASRDHSSSLLLLLNERFLSLSTTTASSSTATTLSLPDNLSKQRQLLRNTSTISSTKPTTNAYVFLKDPIACGESFCIQIVGVDYNTNESTTSLSIGCTTHSPQQLNPLIDLPDDCLLLFLYHLKKFNLKLINFCCLANELIDRPEYWVVYKNLLPIKAQSSSTSTSPSHSTVTIADELCFCVNKQTGFLSFSINGKIKNKCLFAVDHTQKLWFFFDLCGRTSGIRLINSCNHQTQSQQPQQQQQQKVQLRSNRSSRTTPRPSSALIDYYKSQITNGLNLNQINSNGSNDNKSNKRESLNNSSKDECIICLDAPVECVFYSCGHMCLCWKWYLFLLILLEE